MFTAEQTASAGFMTSQRRRFEVAMDLMLTNALEQVAKQVIKEAETYSRVPTPMQMTMTWELALKEAAEISPVPEAMRQEIYEDLRDEDIVNQMYGSATAVFASGMLSGLSQNQIVKDLQDALSLNSGQMALTAALGEQGMSWKSRIKRSARTKATQFLGKMADRSMSLLGMPSKRWVTRKDDKVRDSHEELEGVTIPTNDLFLVGNYSLKYPGDSSGGPEEVINCRCIVVGTYRTT